MSSMAEKLKNYGPSPGNDRAQKKRCTLPDLKSIRKGLHPENCNQKGCILYIWGTQETNALIYGNESPPGSKIVLFGEPMKKGANLRTVTEISEFPYFCN